MKKAYRIGAFLLALCLLLAGCREEGGQTDPSQTTAGQNTTVENTQQPENTSTEPPTETVTEPPAPDPLVMEYPVKEKIITADEKIVIKGTADPDETLQINGAQVQPDASGQFAYELALEVGETAIQVQYLEETLNYTVQRWYTTAWYAFSEDATCPSGSSVYAKIFAREGSTVKINFRGETRKVDASLNDLTDGAPEGFVLYMTRFDAPSKKKEPVDMGVITYTVTYQDVKEVITSGNLTCAAAAEMKTSDPSVTPRGGEYRNVGSGYIAEVVDTNAETFNGKYADDKSLPTMNYLPKGTMDYASQGTYYNESADRYYHLLRCGVIVYKNTNNKPYGMMQVVDCYSGYLPDHNEINIASMTQEGHFTILTLDSMWKAPFFFDDEEQEYRHESGNKYILDDYNASYIDITFCYATVFTGELTIPEDHPLFASAEVIKNISDHTLRLHLKKEGGLYGWNAYYNENDQLCFKFLNPVTVTAADNAFGADLTGLTIMIDVGHGGDETGAAYRTSGGKYFIEAERNLVLSQLVRERLENIGATVIMNRTTGEETITRSERTTFLIQQSPDFCICIHHNADTVDWRNGFESWYFTNLSRDAAYHIYRATQDTDVYKTNKAAWYTYYVARQTVCPVVLAENGYMSYKYDMDRIAKDEYMQQKADALVQGICNYYLELSGYEVTYEKE